MLPICHAHENGTEEDRDGRTATDNNFTENELCLFAFVTSISALTTHEFWEELGMG